MPDPTPPAAWWSASNDGLVLPHRYGSFFDLVGQQDSGWDFDAELSALPVDAVRLIPEPAPSVDEMEGDFVDANERMGEAPYLDIVFDGPPDHDGPRFVEVEDATGASVRAVGWGGWVDRGDGTWALRIPARTALAGTAETAGVAALLRRLDEIDAEADDGEPGLGEIDTDEVRALLAAVPPKTEKD